MFVRSFCLRYISDGLRVCGGREVDLFLHILPHVDYKPSRNVLFSASRYRCFFGRLVTPTWNGSMRSQYRLTTRTVLLVRRVMHHGEE